MPARIQKKKNRQIVYLIWASVSQSWALQQGSWRQRSRVKLVEVEGRTHEPEQNPTSNHYIDGSIGQLVKPKQDALLPHVQLYSLLWHSHGIPVLFLHLLGLPGGDRRIFFLLSWPPPPSPEQDLLWRRRGRWHWRRRVSAAVAGGDVAVTAAAAAFAFDAGKCERSEMAVVVLGSCGNLRGGGGEWFREGHGCGGGVHGFEFWWRNWHEPVAYGLDFLIPSPLSYEGTALWLLGSGKVNLAHEPIGARSGPFD